MSEHLHHKLSVLHQNLLHGKLPRDLHWTDALELIGHLGQAQEVTTGEFAFIIGAHRELFKRPADATLGIDEVSRLRRFLKAAASEAPAADSADTRRVVVIDHHAAHILQVFDPARHQKGVAVEPYDPHHFHHHLIHRKESHFQGGRVPEESSFYEAVAKELLSAKEIVLIGHGTGKSSAVEFLVEYLKKHHPEVSARVVATETADLSALTEPQIQAIAKRHLAPGT